MLCTFTTEHGTLIVRSDDIKVIEDAVTGGAVLVYVVNDSVQARPILGTAAENRDRILQEEIEQVGVVEMHRYRTQQMLAAQPTPRGRQANK